MYRNLLNFPGILVLLWACLAAPAFANCSLVDRSRDVLYITFESFVPDQGKAESVRLRLHNNSTCEVMINAANAGKFREPLPEKPTVQQLMYTVINYELPDGAFVPEVLYRYTLNGVRRQPPTNGISFGFRLLPKRYLLFDVSLDHFEPRLDSRIELPFTYQWETVDRAKERWPSVENIAWFYRARIPSQLADWQNIRPLKTSRAEVTQMLGEGTPDKFGNWVYKRSDGIYTIRFDGDECSDDPGSRKNIEPNTVLYASIDIAAPTTLQEALRSRVVYVQHRVPGLEKRFAQHDPETGVLFISRDTSPNSPLEKVILIPPTAELRQCMIRSQLTALSILFPENNPSRLGTPLVLDQFLASDGEDRISAGFAEFAREILRRQEFDGVVVISAPSEMNEQAFESHRDEIVRRIVGLKVQCERLFILRGANANLGYRLLLVPVGSVTFEQAVGSVNYEQVCGR